MHLAATITKNIVRPSRLYTNSKRQAHSLPQLIMLAAVFDLQEVAEIGKPSHDQKHRPAVLSLGAFHRWL